MKNKKRKIIIITCIVFIILLGVFIYLYLTNYDKKDKDISDTRVVSEIKKYNYTLNENATAYYKEKFNELLELSEEEIDDEKFVSLITSLFLSDYYTLNNKRDKLDVGGLQFILEKEKDDFLKVSTNTIYKYLENNYNGNRKQNLPIVTDIVINKTDKIKYTYLNKTEDAYQISASIKYQEDLGYQREVTLVLVGDNNKFSIVELK